MRHRTSTVFILALITVVGLIRVHTVSAQQVDDAGCFETRPNCVVGRTEWGTGRNSDRLYLRLTNRCGARVYVRACMRMANGSDRCGAFGINPGQTHNFNWTGADERGLTEWRWVGSVRAQSDWVCAGRVSNFTADPRY